MIIVIIALAFCFWLGYKSGYYILELYEKNTISLNELEALIVSTIIFPISICLAIGFFSESKKRFFEKLGNMVVITRRK